MFPLASRITSMKQDMATRLDLSKFVGEHVGDVKTTKLLKDAGAVPCVKTNISTPLLSFESSNDVWGRPTNLYNNKYAPGGSTGGDGALLALGGRIGIGSNVAGSVRYPAHYLRSIFAQMLYRQVDEAGSIYVNARS
ncbi:amidase signature domain-containing protein [Trichoderma afarasin]